MGPTDRAKVENELVVVLYCQKNDAKEEIRYCARYFTVEPNKAHADGLILYLGKDLQSMGVEDILDSGCVLGVRGHPVLVGGGADGASVNTSEQNSMKSFSVLCLGFSGHGALPIASSLLVRMPLLASSSSI